MSKVNCHRQAASQTCREHWTPSVGALLEKVPCTRLRVRTDKQTCRETYRQVVVQSAILSGPVDFQENIPGKKRAEAEAGVVHFVCHQLIKGLKPQPSIPLHLRAPFQDRLSAPLMACILAGPWSQRSEINEWQPNSGLVIASLLVLRPPPGPCGVAIDMF